MSKATTWIKRHKLLFGTGITVLVTLFVVGGFFSYFEYQEKRMREAYIRYLKQPEQNLPEEEFSKSLSFDGELPYLAGNDNRSGLFCGFTHWGQPQGDGIFTYTIRRNDEIRKVLLRGKWIKGKPAPGEFKLTLYSGKDPLFKSTVIYGDGGKLLRLDCKDDGYIFSGAFNGGQTLKGEQIFSMEGDSSGLYSFLWEKPELKEGTWKSRQGDIWIGSFKKDEKQRVLPGEGSYVYFSTGEQWKGTFTYTDDGKLALLKGLKLGLENKFEEGSFTFLDGRYYLTEGRLGEMGGWYYEGSFDTAEKKIPKYDKSKGPLFQDGYEVHFKDVEWKDSYGNAFMRKEGDTLYIIGFPRDATSVNYGDLKKRFDVKSVVDQIPPAPKY